MKEAKEQEHFIIVAEQSALRISNFAGANKDVCDAILNQNVFEVLCEVLQTNQPVGLLYISVKINP